jgi:hypothetical protein
MNDFADDQYNSRRDIGKELFANGKPASAARQYDRALMVLQQNMDNCEVEYVDEKNRLLVLYLVNCAAYDASLHLQHCVTLDWLMNVIVIDNCLA